MNRPPALTPEALAAAIHAAELALPVLVAKGRLHDALELQRKIVRYRKALGAKPCARLNEDKS